MEIHSWSDAKRLGLDKYFTGRACKHGHIAMRYTSTGTCQDCIRASKGVLPKGVERARYAVPSDLVPAWVVVHPLTRQAVHEMCDLFILAKYPDAILEQCGPAGKERNVSATHAQVGFLVPLEYKALAQARAHEMYKPHAARISPAHPFAPLPGAPSPEWR